MESDRMQSHTILEVRNLRMHYPVSRHFLSKSRKVIRSVDGVSFSVVKGETFGLVGESGCGKTTTGKCILRINQPTTGSILFEGKDITHLSTEELYHYRRKMQMVFQDPYGSLDPRQSMRSIIKEAITADRKPHSAASVDQRIKELLGYVGLGSQLLERFPHELSGGQRQRLGIARALACDPDIIICDEPVSALDVSIQAQIINLFKKLQKQLGLTLLFIAHDLAVVNYIADTIAVMYLGKIVEIMKAGDLQNTALHPYSKALLAAIPTTEYYKERNRENVVLEGEIPSPIDVPEGCAFHPRCVYATDRCRAESPSLRTVRDHLVACHHVEGTDISSSGWMENGKTTV